MTLKYDELAMALPQGVMIYLGGRYHILAPASHIEELSYLNLNRHQLG